MNRPLLTEVNIERGGVRDPQPLHHREAQGVALEMP
jgi:hypothetical protein